MTGQGQEEAEVLCDGNNECFRLARINEELIAALKAYRDATRDRLVCGCSELRCALCRQADAVLAKAEGR
jgi:hypothetical protein